MAQADELLQALPVTGIIVAALSVARLLVWLAGLAIAVHSSDANNRPGLLRAYGASLPRILSRAPIAEQRDTSAIEARRKLRYARRRRHSAARAARAARIASPHAGLGAGGLVSAKSGRDE